MDLEIDGQPLEVQAAISDQLPMAVLLGSETRIENSLVVTRARAKQQLEEEAAQRQRELSSGAQPTTLDQIAGDPEQEDLSTEEENEADEEVSISMELR